MTHSRWPFITSHHTHPHTHKYSLTHSHSVCSMPVVGPKFVALLLSACVGLAVLAAYSILLSRSEVTVSVTLDNGFTIVGEHRVWCVLRIELI